MSNKLRFNLDKDFTVVSNAVFRDKNLDYKSLGLLLQIISLPEGWNFSAKGLAAMHNVGVTTVRNSLQSLEECGYLQRKKHQNKQGHWHVEYIIGLPTPKKPTSENPTSGFLTSDNLTTYKERKNKERKNKERKNKINNNTNKKIDEEFIKELALQFQTNTDYISNVAEKMKDWCLAKGKRYKDYRAALRNWVRKDMDQVKMTAPRVVKIR